MDNVKAGPRVVFFATQLYALACGRAAGFGGAETELWNVAQAMARETPFDVRVLTITDEIREPRWFDKLQLWPVAAARTITYQDSWFTRRRAIIAYFIGLFRQLKKQHADIYFSKLASSEASTIWLVSRITRSKFVFRVEHDWETNKADLEHIIFRGSWFWSRLFIFCLRRADLVIAQTEKQTALLKKNFDIEAVIIPNGHVIPADTDIDHEPDNRQTILWVARAHPMKRPDLFLYLAEQMPTIKFVMILAKSSEHTALFNECQARAADLPNVQFIPGLPPNQLDSVYASARVFVLTSEAEGFSNVIIEALKNGAPVISLGHNPNNLLAPSSGNNSELPAAGYFTNESIEKTSSLIKRMIEEPSFWTDCHKQARTIAIENFSLAQVVSAYEKHFTRLSGNA